MNSRRSLARGRQWMNQRLPILLPDRAEPQRSVAALMAAAGLIASGVASADDRRWCGEIPRRTRLQHLA